ncbi:MAG: AMP-binding protein [Betaproteobacteria bacterium]
MSPAALCGTGASLSASALAARVQQLAGALDAARPRPRLLGLIADNGCDWVIADLAAEELQLPLVPLPAFFTQAQLRHVVDTTGMDALLCQAPGLAPALGFAPAGALSGTSLAWFRRAAAPVALPAGTAKITFTSGTTGTPKGVCLSRAQQRNVAAALAAATGHLGIERHLALLPLAVLLENIAGVYAPLTAGATSCVPGLTEVGVGGATGFDPRAALAAIERHGADSVILLPQMLASMTAAIEAGAPAPSRLRLAAVGGARVAPALIERARAAGIPAFEGYGLSECASVLALNLPGADRPGSAGRPLPHVGVRIDDGEIVVDGAGFLGYLGDLGTEAPRHAPVRTGDLGHLDADGYLHIDGRRKHQMITSFGRNVAPEWPESELTATALIAQAAVFGEARPQLCAVLVARSAAVLDRDLDAAVRAANHRLPDYARICAWTRAEAPFGPANGLATASGRVRRDAVWQRYGAQLDSLYEASQGTSDHAVL